MNTKIVYQLDENGVLVGEALADESPLEPGVFIIPGGCVEIEPPPYVEGKLRVFVGNEWHYQDLPQQEEEPEPPLPSLADLRSAKILVLNAKCQAIADQITSAYPDFEKLTWEDQRREATAWQANSAVPTPYIDSLAAIRGIDRVDYLNRTLAKIDVFTNAAQKLVGQRQKYEDQIKAALTVEELNAVNLVITLE